MGTFNYSALNTQGKTEHGIGEADSEKQIRQQLRVNGLIPLEITPVNVNKKIHTFAFFNNKRLRKAELTLLTRQLATLIAASLPIEEALQGVAEQSEKNHCQSILLGVRAKVLEGQSLATALGSFPKAFPTLFCATVAAGEQTGCLDTVLNRLADYTEQQQAFRQKIQQAMIYPSLMTGIATLIVTFLLICIVPKLIHVFTNTGQTLPGVTLTLIAISYFMQHYGIILLILVIIAFFILKYLLKQPHIRHRWHALLLKLPVIGHSIRTVNGARFTRTLGILTAAGVPIIESMQTANRLVGCQPIHTAVIAAITKVHEGMNIHQALKQTRYFSPMTIHLIANGERSGRLEEMLERAAISQETMINRLIDTSLTLFEPLIILIMGAIVLFIVLAILLPIFDLDQLTG